MAVFRNAVNHFLVSILLVTLCFRRLYAADRYTSMCGTIIDTTDINKFSGIIEFAMPENMKRYQDPSLNLNCDVRIMFGSGLQLQVELYNLDIMPISKDQSVCSTGLSVFEGFSSRNIYGGRLCMEGWKWEERHLEMKKEKKIVESSPLTFRLISEGPYRGTGFKAHFNLFRANSVCLRKEFRCRDHQRCVNDDITCDGWDDCGDDSDEHEDAGCGLLTATEIVATIVGVLLFIETVVFLVMFFLKIARSARNYQIEKSRISMASSNQNLKSPPESVLSFPHRFNSMESMNKSNYSRRAGTRRDSDSSIDKNELEKSDRCSYKDNGSERSYRSRQSESKRNYQKKRNRGSSPASNYREKADPVRSSQPDLGTISDKDASDKEMLSKNIDRDMDRRSRDRRRDDRYSDSDDRSPPRRRRSRDRRRYDYSSEEDYDSEYEEERRRRRRRRSQERRSRDRNAEDPDRSDNSDYEREKDRRRRRSRDRYSRDYSDEDRDSDRRRRNSRDRYDREPGSNDDDDYRPPRRRKPSRERDRKRDDYDDKDDHPSERLATNPNREKGRGGDDKRPSPSQEEQLRKPENQPRQSPPPTPPLSEELQKSHQPENRLDRESRRKPDDRRSRSRENIASPPNNQRHSPPLSQRRGEDPRRLQNQGNTPAQPVDDNRNSNWKPRTERRKRRQNEAPVQNLDDTPPPIYEDVNPRGVEMENFGYKEESV